MKSESTSWNKAGVWICSKCMKGTDTADSLKTEWKIKLKELGFNSEVRVMTTSCLNECPPDEQALLIVEKNGKQEIVVFRPKEEADEVLQRILKLAYPEI
jgi:hypothetical protein